MNMRNCVADPNRKEPVYMPALPPKVMMDTATPFCPMLNIRDPRVIRVLRLHRDVRRWNTLPMPGGLYDQLPADVEALNLIDRVMQAPWPDEGPTDG